MKTKIILILCLFLSFYINAQDNTSKESNSIEQQFDNLYRRSNSYQYFKIINKERYQKLKNVVLDSINKNKSDLIQKENDIKSLNEKIVSLQKEIYTTNTTLSKTESEKDSISILGFALNKNTYSISVWSIIALLLIALLVFIYKFFNSNVVTKEAKSALKEVEQELEQHRKKSLEREQKLRRQLQDEINKQRGVK